MATFFFSISLISLGYFLVWFFICLCCVCTRTNEGHPFCLRLMLNEVTASWVNAPCRQTRSATANWLADITDSLSSLSPSLSLYIIFLFFRSSVCTGNTWIISRTIHSWLTFMITSCAHAQEKYQTCQPPWYFNSSHL